MLTDFSFLSFFYWLLVKKSIASPIIFHGSNSRCKVNAASVGSDVQMESYQESFPCSWLVDIAVFMRLLTDICSEVRYFSNRKSQPSGVRAPITNTAMVTSTGRLKTKCFWNVQSQACCWSQHQHFQRHLLGCDGLHGAVGVLPLFEQLCGSGHAGRVVSVATEQQQVAPQHPLRH